MQLSTGLYHIIWVPKYRFRILKGAIKELVEHDIRSLCQWKESIVKGKIAFKLFKSYPKLKQKPYLGNHFWACGYFVSTVGLGEDTIRKYVKYQEKEEKMVEDHQQRFDF
ncbi:transposase [Pricia sp.]|uniref:transposase n=1 Tax=Pricia sp. TaxID=2268138 RepID=UPI00359413BD